LDCRHVPSMCRSCRTHFILLHWDGKIGDSSYW